MKNLLLTLLLIFTMSVIAVSSTIEKKESPPDVTLVSQIDQNYENLAYVDDNSVKTETLVQRQTSGNYVLVQDEQPPADEQGDTKTNIFLWIVAVLGLLVSILNNFFHIDIFRKASGKLEIIKEISEEALKDMADGKITEDELRELIKLILKLVGKN